MTQPRRIYYCAACGRVAEVGSGPGSLLAQGCEGTHQQYVRRDLFDRLIEAIVAHEKAYVGGPVSKSAWEISNGELYRERVAVEQEIGDPAR